MQADLFKASIKSPYTYLTYQRGLVTFEGNTNYKLTPKCKPKHLEEKMIEYVISAKEKGLSYSRINNVLSAVEKYAFVYRIEINSKWVRQYMPELIRRKRDRAYEKSEIRSMLAIARPRERALVLFVASTGVRRGVIPNLKLRDLTKLDDGCYKAKVYDESEKSRYVVWTSLEAANALDVYFRSRVDSGDNVFDKDGKLLESDSPVFRAEFSEKTKEVKGIGDVQTTRLIQELAIAAGILERVGKVGQRGKIQSAHGLRKFFNTSLVRARLDERYVNLLMWGHSKGLQNNYLDLHEGEVYNERKKAESELTISEEPMLRKEVDRLTLKVADDRELKLRLARTEERLAKAEEDNAYMMEIMKGRYERFIASQPKRTPEEEKQYLEYLAEWHYKEYGL